MKQTMAIGLVFIAVVSVLSTPRAAAQGGGGFQITGSTIAGGGSGGIAGGVLSIAGSTINQPGAAATIAGGTFSVQGGLWWIGSGVVMAVEEPQASSPLSFRVAPSTPNPFNPSTTIAFDLPDQRRVEARVYDMSGRLVRTLIAGTLDAGSHATMWDGRDDAGAPQASGVYVFRLEAGGMTAMQKLVLVK